jgi:glutamate N-acetyltransferase / amino-acid N-acetyltransferase
VSGSGSPQGGSRPDGRGSSSPQGGSRPDGRGSSSQHALTPVEGGVCAAEGIAAAGVAAGLKPSGKLDLALVAAEEPVAAAAVQTRNQIVAAPVTVTRRHLADGRARAVLLNSGSANVCTGGPGEALAEESAEVVAGALGCAAADVLLCSTGVIGVPVPRGPLLAGIPAVTDALSRHSASDAAQAILTTDLVAKEVAVRVDDDAGSCVIGGMAKGSGMIDPAMATMLCVVTTDAALEATLLRGLLSAAVDRTFGRISVDGCMSTNDAVVVLATGRARRTPSIAAVEVGLHEVCARLAEAIVRDGEGAQKLVRIRVTGTRSEEDAVAVGRAIGSSALVKTAVAGGDPNWGRVMGAIGASPVAIEPAQVAVQFGEVTVCHNGMHTPFDRRAAAAALNGPEVLLSVDLGLGDEQATFLTCDLTHGYVTINAEYTT